ncbi:DNA-directed DNA polymerase [Tanacetum coccineum]|uniref:DNA-directed DNA polymerase n=1 Tax=Tanacetum coccineum TaxID=301880 RepID=A0ABQ5BHP2_9ASTR
MKPREVTEEQIKLRAFPFLLADKAKNWLYYLPSGCITTWDQMKQQFLKKKFLASRAANIRKDMSGICQFNGEMLYEYWESFKQLCASCPQHQVTDQLLIQYFYEGLLTMDRNTIDAASGGALVHKTPTEARTLISNMAANSQQFGTRQECPTKIVSEVKTSYDQRLDNLTTLVENSPEQMNVVGGFLGPPQRKYDPFSNTYNPGWRDHPNFSYGSHSNNFQQQYPKPTTHSQPSSLNSSISLENIQNVSAITLRSGKVLEEQALKQSKHDLEKEIVKEGSTSQNDQPQETNNLQDEIKILPLFPGRFAMSRKQEQEKEVLETFRKVELKGNEKVLLGENVSAMIQKKLPIKCKDPGMFTIPCKMGNVEIERAMLDLGASINVMPRSIYEAMNVGKLKETGVVIQLADHMGNENHSNTPSILLGRPFLKTTRTNICVHEGTLSMEFDGQVIKFNIYDSMKYPGNEYSVFSIDVIDSLVPKVYELNDEDSLKVALTNTIIITPLEDERLIRILRDYKEETGWTIADISGISPSMCMHKILLEEGATPVKQVQRRLNPPMMEVVKKEIQKLLDAGIIYPISDNKWVSPMQVVPKKTGVTVIENSNGFHQIPVAPEDQEKTTFTCPFGTFAFRRMSFGLCNAPATFQRCMAFTIALSKGTFQR